MNNKRIAALIILAALGGYVLGRLSADLRLRIPAPPIRLDSSPFLLENPGVEPDHVELLPLSGAPFLGPAMAKVTVVEFCDFECPFCRRVAPTLLELMERYEDDLRLVFLNLPLPMHPNAQLAAQAALAAHAQGRFWPFHDRLFMSRQPLTRDTLEEIAGDVGLDLPSFQQALDRGTYTDRIAEEQALADRLGFNGTPAFLINGRQVMGAKPIEEFIDLIEEEIGATEALLDQGIPLSQVHRLRIQQALGGGTPERMGLEPTPVRETPPRTERTAQPAVPTPDTVELDLFADFASREYRQLGQTLEQLLGEYPERLTISFHSFLDPADQLAVLTAAALYQARLEDRLMEYHHALVSCAGELTREILEGFAADLDFDLAAFQRALDDPSNQEIARRLRQEAEDQGVILSPTLFLGGHRFVGVTPPADLRTAIRAVLDE